jgi:hypothetical protein
MMKKMFVTVGLVFTASLQATEPPSMQKTLPAQEKAGPLNRLQLQEVTQAKSTKDFSLPPNTTKAHDKKATEALRNAKEATKAILPVVTAGAVGLMLKKPSGGYLRMDLRPLGLLLLPGVIILDVLKLPFAVGIATEEAIRGCIPKTRAAATAQGPDDPQAATEAALLASGEERMKSVVKALLAMNLETRESLQERIDNHHYGDLVAYTLLATAFASRNEVGDTLQTATVGKVSWPQVPDQDRPLFALVVKLKNKLHSAHTSPKDDNASARWVSEWMPSIVQAVHSNSLIAVEGVNSEQIKKCNEVVDLVRQIAENAMSLDFVSDRAEEFCPRHLMDTVRR